ncbi:MAG: SoxY-related AACIE arm protein [Alphaproteobacteria bacterium]
MTECDPSFPTRRCFLRRSTGFAAAAGIAAAWPAAPVRATPEAMREAIRAIVGEAELQQGKITLDIPMLVENGNAVPLTVSVDSPMMPADHVKALHIVSEKSPQPQAISVALGPRAGRARLSTRIKLAASQKIVAVAEMSDGSFWTASADVLVTLAACVEDLQ